MSTLKVRDLMTRNVEVLDVNDDVDFAGMLMRVDKLRHLPVVSEGRLVGLVSERDLLRAQLSSVTKLSPAERRAFALRVLVTEVMTRDVQTITPDAPAVEAAKLLRQRKFGCLPVVDGEEIVGIVTESDFLDFAITTLSSPN